MSVYDVTIIGGGPAGLYSAFYSGLRDLKTKILEVQPRLGGKINIFSEKMLWDIGGQPPILAGEFAENLKQQAAVFNPTVCLNSKVQFIRKENDIFVIETANGDAHFTKTVIIATGGGIFNPVKLEIEDAEKYEMKNLHYTIKGLNRFKNHEILISGGGNGAIDWAVELLHIAKKVTVIYRKEALTAHEAQIKKLQEHNVEILLNAEINSLLPNQDKTSIGTALINQNGMIRSIDLDDLIINHGYNREISLNFSSGIEPERKDDYYLKSIGQCKTTVPGIFAAGDIVAYDDKVGLILGTFQDAVLAVNSAKLYMEPEANKYGMVSSHNEKFTQRNQEILKEVIRG